MELVKNHFHEEKETQSHKFTHPQPLAEHEVGTLRQLLPKWDRFASDLNIHHFLNRSGSRESRAHSIPEEPAAEASTSRRGVAFGETPTPPARSTFSGLRQRFFGRNNNTEKTDDVETGQQTGSSPYSTSTPTPKLSPTTTRQPNSQLDLTRTETMSRTIRFAEHATNDSDTAPGPLGSGNYGNSQPGFRKTPGLAMFRSTSVKSEDEA